jgi:prophage tail gpP-like protein
MKVKIAGDFFEYFSGLAINLKLDAIGSIFSFDVRFNPENPLHRKLFKPLSYQRVELFNSEDQLIFTGIIINHVFTSAAQPQLLNLSGYSLPGILEDVTVPVSSYPLESINRSLKDVAERLLGLFNIELVIDPSAATAANQIYKKSVAAPTDTVKAYLAKLTAQRNLVLSHNERGQVIIYRPGSTKPVYFFNGSNTNKMKLTVNGQALHSDISVIRQPSAENAGVSTADTVKNPLISAFRPQTKILSSGEDTDVKNAADNELASELKNIELVIDLNRVENILPGSIVEVLNPENFIFKKTLFMVIDVSIKTGTADESSTFKLVLPETFTAAEPSKIFDA